MDLFLNENMGEKEQKIDKGVIWLRWMEIIVECTTGSLCENDANYTLVRHDWPFLDKWTDSNIFNNNSLVAQCSLDPFDVT